MTHPPLSTAKPAIDDKSLAGLSHLGSATCLDLRSPADLLDSTHDALPEIDPLLGSKTATLEIDTVSINGALPSSLNRTSTLPRSKLTQRQFFAELIGTQGATLSSSARPSLVRTVDGEIDTVSISDVGLSGGARARAVNQVEIFGKLTPCQFSKDAGLVIADKIGLLAAAYLRRYGARPEIDTVSISDCGIEFFVASGTFEKMTPCHFAVGDARSEGRWGDAQARPIEGALSGPSNIDAVSASGRQQLWRVEPGHRLDWAVGLGDLLTSPGNKGDLPCLILKSLLSVDARVAWCLFGFELGGCLSQMPLHQEAGHAIFMAARDQLFVVRWNGGAPGRSSGFIQGRHGEQRIHAAVRKELPPSLSERTDQHGYTSPSAPRALTVFVLDRSPPQTCGPTEIDTVSISFGDSICAIRSLEKFTPRQSSFRLLGADLSWSPGRGGRVESLCVVGEFGRACVSVSSRRRRLQIDTVSISCWLRPARMAVKKLTRCQFGGKGQVAAHDHKRAKAVGVRALARKSSRCRLSIGGSTSRRAGNEIDTVSIHGLQQSVVTAEPKPQALGIIGGFWYWVLWNLLSPNTEKERAFDSVMCH